MPSSGPFNLNNVIVLHNTRKVILASKSDSEDIAKKLKERIIAGFNFWFDDTKSYIDV